MEFHENQSKGSGDMEQTGSLRVDPMTLTLSLDSWVMCSAQCLTKRII